MVNYSEKNENNETFDNLSQRRIYTVSKLTTKIKALLEQNFPFIWINGEISNLSIPASGHYYFSLKDNRAQIRAVMFRGQNRNLTFALENGQKIIGFGRISLYEPRGTYQLIMEYIEPAGLGSLQLAFEQLKSRLADEGFFAKERKKPLPFLPQIIAVITSPTGAVISDILNVIDRRFPNIAIKIIPVKVQGPGADKEIVSAIEFINQFETTDFGQTVDLAILARGGGSFEDLNAFNQENVVRAIFNSKIPIISAVGHETDFTIADFAADLRAPTPSAAAEIAVPSKEKWHQRCQELLKQLILCLKRETNNSRLILDQMITRLVDPEKKIQDQRLWIDDYYERLLRAFSNDIKLKRKHTSFWQDRLITCSPLVRQNLAKDSLKKEYDNLKKNIDLLLQKKRSGLNRLITGLYALSPKAILERGYSITRSLPEQKVILDANSVKPGQSLEIILARGIITSTVSGPQTLEKISNTKE